MKKRVKLKIYKRYENNLRWREFLNEYWRPRDGENISSLWNLYWIYGGIEKYAKVYDKPPIGLLKNIFKRKIGAANPSYGLNCLRLSTKQMPDCIIFGIYPSINFMKKFYKTV